MAEEKPEGEDAKVVPFPVPRTPAPKNPPPKCTCNSRGIPCAACDS